MSAWLEELGARQKPVTQLYSTVVSLRYPTLGSMNDCCEDASCGHLEYEDCDDPTMMSCCRRDLQERRYGQRLRDRLLAVDPSQRRLQQTKEAVLRSATQTGVYREPGVDAEGHAGARSDWAAAVTRECCR